MDAERRRLIEDLFEAALEEAPEERDRFLAKACGGDAKLRSEVAALLASHERAAGALERPVAGLAASLLDRRLDDRLGARHIGPYRVLRELGRGGMGVVYLAERDDGQYRRRVAVKLVRSGLDDGQIHRRFLAERQILASLNHPNIAQLLEGGVADGQLPYLVMEYVEGIPITSYCDKHRLSIAARVRLFQQVCAAVHHAHQNLVIHRDLKPSNIVVDGQGNVKLLDFGIAKLVNPVLGPAEAPLTRLEHWIMTPEYASPEQVRGEPLTTASDIYSLGVILYELLAGHRPYQLDTGAPNRVVELVCERDPERPSTRASQTEVVTRGDGTAREITPAEVSAARETTPERLPKQLRGDLDAIVMMALRKEPGRRYGSAAMLSEDLQRHLDGLPVQAHSGSRAYRARKFLRRHRVEAAAAGLVGLSLLAGAGLASWQATLARSERDRAEAARSEAESARTEAEAVADFLMGLFEASDPDRTQGDTITAGELLERGIARAEALAGQPLVQARMFSVVGRVYQSMGRYDRAQPLLERAVELEIEQRGRGHVQVATALVHLAEVLRRRAQYDSAQALLREAESIQAAALGPDDPLRAETLHALSRVAVHRGDMEAAERWARDALSLQRRTLGATDAASIATLTHLGTVLRGRGDFDGAEAAYREAIRLRQEGGGGASGYLGELLQLADLQLHERAQREEAEATYRQAVAVLRAETDPDPSHMVRALGGLARTLESRGDAAGAESLLREALEVRRNTYGPEHPLVSAGMIHLAGLFERTRRYSEAEALFRQVADLDGRILGESHPTHAGTLTAIGRVLIAAGRYSDADTVLARAAAIRVAALGPDHPLMARTLRQQAEARLRQGDVATAESMLRRALEIKLQQTTPEANEVRQLHSLLAEVHSARGDHEEAERYRTLARQE